MIRRPVLGPLVVGGAGLVLGLVQAAFDPTRALFAYTAGFAIALTIALGALLFVMIAHTARARWFVVLRRLTSAIAATLPLFPLLFIPIALGVTRLFPWAGPVTLLDADQRAWVAHVHPWLNVPFFLVRSYVYLFLWAALAVTLRSSSIAQDDRPADANVVRQRRVSAAAFPVMAVTLTLAAFDWVVSLQPVWASDMMGVYLFAGAFAGAVGVVCVAAFLAWRAKLLPREVGADHFHALGRVLFMSVIFWAYIAFCQFVLVWVADMARETSFYADRVGGGWTWIVVVLFVSHFAVPFLLLLSRPLKRVPGRLALVGGWLAFAHALDVYWLIVPALHAGARGLDLAFIVGIAGVCTAFAVSRFLSASPIPVHDPALAESLRYESP